MRHPFSRRDFAAMACAPAANDEGIAFRITAVMPDRTEITTTERYLDSLDAAMGALELYPAAVKVDVQAIGSAP